MGPVRMAMLLLSDSIKCFTFNWNELKVSQNTYRAKILY